MTDDDDKRLVTLFHAFCGHLAAFAGRRVPQAMVEDIVSRTFETAWRKVRAIPETDEQALLWLYGVAWGHVRNGLRAEIRGGRLLGRLKSLRQCAAVPDLAGEVTDRVVFEELMARLPPRDREVLRLHYWEELTVGEVARVLNCRPNAVAVRLHRARRRLEEIVRTCDA